MCAAGRLPAGRGHPADRHRHHSSGWTSLISRALICTFAHVVLVGCACHSLSHRCAGCQVTGRSGSTALNSLENH